MRKDCKSVEMRGVWVATVYNIDWPKILNDPEAQKKEFIDILDKLKSLNFNAVFVQVRTASDALYKSKIHPWSEVLTGMQGKDPGYDPLEFMIEEAHKRNMELHAWLNPYRVTTQGTDLSVLADNNIAKIRPDWALEFEDALFLNPQNPDVIKCIGTTVYEIIKNYDVDGIHFDDYFYPYNYPLPEGEDREGDIANSRRDAVTYMLRFVNRIIKQNKPNVEFGVSPFGVWKNNSSDPLGSNSKNLESYYDAYMDTVSWVENKIVDYIAPQVYWEIENKNSKYENLVSWWSNIVKGSEVRLYIGQNIDNEVIAQEIEQEIKINRQYSKVEGSIFFSSSNILNNDENVVEQFEHVYNCEAITPSKASKLRRTYKRRYRRR